jgi:hypothetical protein
MVIQVVIRLTLYIDQALFKPKAHGFQHGIQNTVSTYFMAFLFYSLFNSANFYTHFKCMKENIKDFS